MYDSSKLKLDRSRLVFKPVSLRASFINFVVNDDIGVVSIAVRVGAPVSPVCRCRLRAAAVLRIFNAWVRKSDPLCASMFLFDEQIEILVAVEWCQSLLDAAGRFRDGVAGFLRESVVLRCAPSCPILIRFLYGSRRPASEIAAERMATNQVVALAALTGRVKRFHRALE
jgi:hypothetical protein